MLRCNLCVHRFETINVAMGNTRVAPYSFCVDAHAGIDADIISWEMVRKHHLNCVKQKPLEGVCSRRGTLGGVRHRPGLVMVHSNVQYYSTWMFALLWCVLLPLGVLQNTQRRCLEGSSCRYVYSAPIYSPIPNVPRTKPFALPCSGSTSARASGTLHSDVIYYRQAYTQLQYANYAVLTA